MQPPNSASRVEKHLKLALLASSWITKLVVTLGALAAVFTLAGLSGSTKTLTFLIPAAIVLLAFLQALAKLHYTYFVEIPQLQMDLKRRSEEMNLKCPLASLSAGGCPLGVKSEAHRTHETLDSIFDTTAEYHFVGYGSENILLGMEHSPKRRDFHLLHAQTKEPITFSFVVRDPNDQALMKEQQDRREPPLDKIPRPAVVQITNAIELHNRYRHSGWQMVTYLADTLASFRVVIVDDLAYVSFNRRGFSSQECPQVIFKNGDGEFNMFKWFYEYVRLAEMDVERKNRQSVVQRYVISPSSKAPEDSHCSCVFCSIINRGSSKPYDTIIYQETHFVVIPARGHFAPGYLLLISKEHLCSFAAMPNRLNPEWLSLCDKVKSELKKLFCRPVVVFEHGSLFGGGFAGNTIEHAHLHIVPCSVDLAKALVDDGRATKRIQGIEELRSYYRPYLFVSSNGTSYVAEVESEMKSQYLRRLLYNCLFPDRDDNGWDWHTHVHEDLLNQTLVKMFANRAGE